MIFPSSAAESFVSFQAQSASSVQARADRVLRGDGLSVGSVKEEESNRLPGTVLWTDPRAGAAVWPGSSVDLVVAKRSDQVKVPDVVGKDQVWAARMLRAGGLSVGSVTEKEVPDQKNRVPVSSGATTRTPSAVR